MRILGLFLNNELRTGGHRRYLELLEGLAARGNEVVLVANAALAPAPRGVRTLCIPVDYRRGQLFPVSLAFRKAVRRAFPGLRDGIGKPDFILIHGETNLAAAAWLKGVTGARILFGHRSNAVRESLISLRENRGRPLLLLRAIKERSVYGRYERRLAALADVVVFQSAFDLEDVRSRVPALRAVSVVIPGNIAPPRFLPATEGINRGGPPRRLLFVGTLGERKGIRYLLEALVLLDRAGFRELELDAIGPGEARPALEAWVAEQGLAARVRFHGRVADPFSFYAAADLMVVPSLFDSFPDTVLESFHCGIPVIGSAVGGIPEMIGRPDLLFPPREAPAIAALIRRAIEEPAWFEEARTYCHERRRSYHFDWAERWEAAMRGTLPPASAGGQP